MDNKRSFGLALFLSTASALAQTPTAPPSVMPVVAPMSAAECAVWEREKSFAAASARHDSANFAEHLHPGAVFINGNEAPTRGREGVLKDWAPIIAGKDFHLGWYPGFVTMTGDDHIAISRGPFWIESHDPKADAASRFRIGNYQSIWVKDGDGVWHVLVDGGTAPPRPSNEEEVAKLKAGLAAT